LKNLKIFKLGGYSKTILLEEREMTHFVDLTTLHTLSLSMCTLPDQFCTYLKHITSLKRLELWNCTNVTSQLMNLDGILLDSFCFQNDLLDLLELQVPTFPNLTELVLCLSSISDEWVNNLPVFPKAHTLTISSDELTNMSIKFFPNQFPSLTNLDIGSCTKITDVKTEYFPNLMHLKSGGHII